MTRGVPEQDLPENQDESVRYMVDEMTGRKTRLDEKGNPIEDEESKDSESVEKPKPGRKRTSGPDAEKADDAGAGKPATETRETSAAVTSRTLGS